ncbi:MAG: hypothetical protein NZO58_07340 [Gemmataceae bacterium]|nr:hypothetical protein [Gemmataceae bacterium]
MNAAKLGKALSLLAAAVVLVNLVGCNNKGKYADKVTVVVGEQLKAKGVELVDWRHSSSEKSFGVKLKAQQPVDDNLKISIRVSGRGAVSPVGSVGKRINNREWIDVGGRLMGQFADNYPFQDLPEGGTITIDLASR